MCGIFGIVVRKNYPYVRNYFKKDINNLFILSESRGKEASGLSFINDNQIIVCKESISASSFIKTKDYINLIKKNLPNSKNNTVGFIGHSRLVTNGSSNDNNNNQPVIAKNIIGVHNGIIVNSNQLWQQNKSIKKKTGLDSEVIFKLIDFYNKKYHSLDRSLLKTFDQIYGQASIAFFSKEFNKIVLFTNHGSLFLCFDKTKNFLVFASEKIILEKYINLSKSKKYFDYLNIQKVEPNSGFVIDLTDLSSRKLLKNMEYDTNYTSFKRDLVKINFSKNKKYVKDIVDTNKSIPAKFLNNIKALNIRIKKIRRCTKCILPRTFPFIDFDDIGVCNFCNNYNRYTVKDLNKLKSKIKLKLKYSKNPNILMAVSGGRDSCFGLHYAVKELGLNPITYTYDWGLITDLARRNISRMVGKLGLEHILVSSDVIKKRKFVKQKVTAWLKNPNLALIPLFQSGDKQYFYYMKKVMKDNKLNFSLYTENPLEKTNFKTGFSGIFEGDNKNSRVYDTSLLNKFQLGLYFAKEFLKNPSYINLSILDTLGGYLSSFFIKHDFEFMFQYHRWKEEEINNELINNYNWERAKDTTSTWRIGDGTAPFYNYIYYTVAGFTENDTFRSNQIREGVISRQKALEKAYRENQPRWDSLKWYCDTINIDFNDTIKKINKIDKLY